MSNDSPILTSFVVSDVYVCSENYPNKKILLSEDNKDTHYYINDGFPGAERSKAVITVDETTAILETGNKKIFYKN